jgi:hypothetical protein
MSEFLTHETTCASEMPEKTTCEKFCQKRPPTSGGTPSQATRGTCRLGQWRQAPAAVAVGPACAATSPAANGTSPAANGGGGMVLPPHLPPMVMAAWCCHLTCRHGDGGMVPPMVMAAWCCHLTSVYRMPGCRQWQRRQGCHLARDAATRRGSFSTKIFAGGLF